MPIPAGTVLTIGQISAIINEAIEREALEGEGLVWADQWPLGYKPGMYVDRVFNPDGPWARKGKEGAD